MNYREAMEYINGIAKFGSHLGLDNIRTLMHYLGDPQDDMQYVHVAGTNGKGSTVSYISHILMAAGMKTGIYTSPFIQRFSERIKVNDTEISDEDLARLTGTVKEAVDRMKDDGCGCPTEFEVVNAIAFLYFKENSCDICVLEVGLGGRLDATNVIRCPLLAVITTISYDHMEILGDTLAKIAYEKAGIIKEGGDVLIYPQKAEAEEIFEKVCRERHATLHRAAMPVKLLKADLDGQSFLMAGSGEMHTGLLGNYQINNAALASDAALILKEKGLPLDDEIIRTGIAETVWPGRFELVGRNPDFIIDGSHNVEGMQKLRDSLNIYFGGKKIIFILGILKDKQYEEMIDIILPMAEKIFTVTPPTPRALTSCCLAQIINSRGGVRAEACETVETACEKAQSLAAIKKNTSENEVICACGSLYYIGQVRSIML